MQGDLNYCARCGAPLTLQQAPGQPSVLVCTRSRCGRVTYRNAKPCAGALVEHEGRVLLVQRAIEPSKGMWDIPGGFLEEWEHPTEGALREVREETGLDIELTALLGIFVDLYDKDHDNTLNIYYRARVVGGMPRASDETLALGWFTPNKLPAEIAFPEHQHRVLGVWRESLKRVPYPTPDPSMATFVSPLARRNKPND